MHLKFGIRQLGQLICVREPKWNPLKAGREAALVAALRRNWVTEPGQKLSVQNLRGQQNAKTPKDPIINSIFSVAAKTKCQELTLSSRMTGGTARRTTSRVPRTPRTSGCTDSDDDKCERTSSEMQPRLQLHLQLRLQIQIQCAWQKPQGCQQCNRLGWPLPQVAASFVWHGTLSRMGWYGILSSVACSCNCNYICQRSYCGPTAAVHL